MTEDAGGRSRGGSLESLVGQVADEFTERLNRGEHPDIEEYAERYPEIAHILRQALPALQAVGSLVPGSLPSDEAALEQSPLAGCLGDFRIIRQIGRGGMGIVYEAEQISLGRRVALKVLPFAAALDSKQLQRFKNEAHAAAHLQHTNIVPVYAVGCERGVHFYAMQYVEGQTLAALIRDLRQLKARQGKPPAELQPLTEPRPLGSGSADQPEKEIQAQAPAKDRVADLQTTGPYALPPFVPAYQPGIGLAPGPGAEVTTRPVGALSTEDSTKRPEFFYTVANLGIQAAEALEHAHKIGIIHRDIKPANLIVDARGNLWITDFGLAHCQGACELTMSGDLLGTLRYMSPEQALAKRVIVDGRTDIYSLGVTLYELLTLEPAFPGTDRQEVLRRIAFDEPKAPRRWNKRIPPELETILLKAMEKNPEDRYATAQELADDLERYLKNEPIRARRPSLVQRTRKWAQRHKPVVGAAVIVLTLVGLVIAAEGWRVINRRAAAEEQGGFALKEATLLLGQQKWRDALAALKPVAALVADGSGTAELRNRTQQLRKDLEMAAQLDNLRLQKHHGGDSSFSGGDPSSAVGYPRAFEGYGIDVLSDPREQVAASIQAQSIREQLVAALDDWILVQTDPRVRERLRAIAELADANEWRNQMRKAVVQKDRRALEELAARPEVANFPPATAYLLGQALANAGSGLGAVEVLAAAQQRYPQDFWLNYQLGIQFLWGPGVQHNAQIAAGYLRAALVARPDFPVVYVYLGLALPGPEHLNEIIALNRKAIELAPNYYEAHTNLGTALQSKGLLDGAIEEFREAVRLRPDSDGAHNCLGIALAIKGRLDRAIIEFQESLRINKKMLGPDHPHTLGDIVNLAQCYTHLGRPDDALKLYEEILPVMKAKFPDHEFTFNCMNGLANCYSDLGRHADALRLHEETLALRKAKFGSDHPDTLSGMVNLANSYAAVGRRLDALKLYEEALPVMKAKMPDHQFTFNCMSGLANCYHHLGRHPDALKLHEQTLSMRKTKLGSDHPDTLSGTVNLANSYAAVGRRLDALKLYEEALPVMKAKMPDHQFTFNCMSGLANCYSKLGRHADALKLREETLALRRRKLGPHHPHTLMSMETVAESLAQLQRGSEAVSVIDECVKQATGKVIDPRLLLDVMDLRLRHFEKSKDGAGCRQTAEMWEKLKRTDGPSLYKAACFRAVATAVLGTADKSPGTGVQADAEADQAMSWLKQAIAAGYKDAARMKKDTDLDALRQREDFKKLIADLEKKTPPPDVPPSGERKK